MTPIQFDSKVQDKRVSDVPIVLYVHPIKSIAEGEPIRLACAGVFPNPHGEIGDTFFCAEQDANGELQIQTHIATGTPERCGPFNEFSRRRSIDKLNSRLKSGALNSEITVKMNEAFRVLTAFYPDRMFFMEADRFVSVQKSQVEFFESTYDKKPRWIEHDHTKLFDNYMEHITRGWVRDKEKRLGIIMENIDRDGVIKQFFSEKTVSLNKLMIHFVREAIRGKVSPLEITQRASTIWTDSDGDFKNPQSLSTMPTLEGLVANTACIFKDEVFGFLKAVHPLFSLAEKLNDDLDIPHPVLGVSARQTRHELWAYYSNSNALPKEIFLTSRYTMCAQALAGFAFNVLHKDASLRDRLLAPNWEIFKHRLNWPNFDESQLDYEKSPADLSFMTSYEMALYVEAMNMRDNPKFSLYKQTLPPALVTSIEDLVNNKPEIFGLDFEGIDFSMPPFEEI